MPGKIICTNCLGIFTGNNFFSSLPGNFFDFSGKASLLFQILFSKFRIDSALGNLG